MSDPPNRKRIVLFVGVGALATAIALAAYGGHILRSVESDSVDTRFSIRGSNGPPKDVVVVAVDFETDKYFAVRKRPIVWPYRRRLHAKVIDRIAAGSPKAIAIDLEFIDETNPVDDNALITSVQNAGDVILSTQEVDEHGNTYVFGGPKVTRRIGAHVGSSLFPIDSDHVIRRVQESVGGLTTFGVAAAAVAEGKPVPAARGGTHWIDFAGPPGTVKTYSYSDVYVGKVPSSAFRDQVVVLGTSAPAFHDIHLTSMGLMAGPEVQANAIETVLQGYPLRSVPSWLNVLLIVVFSLLPLIAVRFGLVWTCVVVLAAGVVLAAAAQGAFNAGRVIVFTYPLLALALSLLGSLVIWDLAGGQAATMSDNKRL